MPDSKAGTWAAINGLEFANSSRTIAYIKNYGLPIEISEDCWCPSITGLLSADCSDIQTNYYLPPSDPAPWYDVAIPESGGFLGFLTTEFEGLGSTFTRNTFETLSGGAVLGKLRPQARTMTWRGYLFGVNCCSADYGLRWLTARLSDAGGCDGCEGGADVDILICCPEIIECDDCESGLKEDPQKDNGIGPASDAFRSFHRAGLIDGPKMLSRRELGCGAGGCGAGDSSCGNCVGCIVEIEFSIVAGNPYMHRDPVEPCPKQSFPSCTDTGNCLAEHVWEKITTTTYPAGDSDSLMCLDKLDCSLNDSLFNCLLDPDCPTATLPTIPPFEDSCGGCEGFFTTRICCSISNDIYGQFFEGVPTISIYTGKLKPMRNVVVSFYENPQERTCDDPEAFASDCYKCASVNIRYIPADTVLTVDGLTKRIMAKCGNQDVQAAESLTTSPFLWPVLKCVGYLVTVEADCSFGVSTDATVSLIVTPREM